MTTNQFRKNKLIMITMIKLLAITVSSLILFNSCSKSEENTTIKVPVNEDFIIFGNLFGECLGDCRVLYLLTDEKLYEDSNNPRQEEVSFNNNQLSNEKRNIADTLFVTPQSLSTNSFSNEDIIQNIADFDYFLQGKLNGVEFRLTYDEIDSTKNIELFEYSQNVKRVIEEVK